MANAGLETRVDLLWGTLALRILARDSDVDRELSQGLRELLEIVGGVRCSVGRLDPSGDFLDIELDHTRPGLMSTLGARYHRHEVPITFGEIDQGRVAHARVDAPNDGNPEIVALLEEEGTSASIAVPSVLDDGSICGIVAIDYVDPAPAFAPPLLEALLRFSRFVGVARSTVKQRRESRERLMRRQRLESLGVLAGGVAHDFNNALQVIQIFGETVLEAVPEHEEEARRQGEQVLLAAERAADMTRRLLVFSREKPSAPVATRLGPELDRTISMARRLVPKSVHIDVTVAEELEDVWVQVPDLDQAILNIINNASDAMPDGGTLTVRGERRTVDLGDQPPGPHVVLDFRDTGTGMTPEVLKRACDPFFTTKAVGEGTGLGLAMVHGLLERVHGRLMIESDPGRGTSITLVLPESAAPKQDNRAAATAAGGTETVLVAEDDAIVRRVARTILEDAGYTVVAASNGSEAIERLEEHPEVALVVSDVIMPVAGGAALLAALEDREQPMPVLFTSGYTADSLLDEVLKAPHVRFLSKPYARNDMLGLARELLDLNAGKSEA